MLQCIRLIRIGQPQLHQLPDLAIQPLPTDGRLVGIPSLALQARAGLWQQVGQRALVFLIVQEWQQVLLLQRELACQLPIGVGSLGRGGAQQCQ